MFSQPRAHKKEEGFVTFFIGFLFLLQTRLQNATKLKKILQDSKDSVVESNIRTQMQPLKDLLTSTINHLHTVFEIHSFISICRGYWDRMGQVSRLTLEIVSTPYE